MKFKKGDEIRHKETGTIDIVLTVPGIREYDKENYLDSKKGFCLKNNGWERQENWELISSKKMTNKKVKYILKYDLQNAEDPYEEFTTLDEVKKRIEELITNNEGIIMSSVRVYEVKSVAKAETQIVFN